MTDLEPRLGPALRDRMADVQPDLDRLLTTSLRAGTAIRRRRRAAISLSAAAGVAVVAVAGSQLGGSGTQASDAGVGFAAAPTAAPTLTPAECAKLLGAPSDRGRRSPFGTPEVKDPASAGAATDEVQACLAIAATPSPPVPTATPVEQGGEVLPVSVSLPGWDCDPPMDQKFGCTDGTAVVTVSLRPAAHRAAYLDPAKADVVPGIRTFVSQKYGKHFASVAPGLNATQADVDAIAEALAWS